MKIGYDISQTGSGKAGCGFFAHSLLNSIVDDTSYHFVLYPSFGDFYFDQGLQSSTDYRQGNVVYRGACEDKAKASAFWHQPNIEQQIGSPDIIHSNNFWCPTNIRSSRLIYTLYDLGFCLNADWTTEANRVGCMDGVFKASLFADYIVAISHHSKDHFLRVFPYYPEERVKVIYPCSRFDLNDVEPQMPESLSGYQPNEFWLSVGTIEPRKNHELLIKAYKIYKQQTRTPKPLVLAGGDGWLMDDFKAKIGNAGLVDDVLFTGYISDEELTWLYKNCFANLYPSFFEGFGLPALEGMKYGALTISSNCTSLPEIVGKNGVMLDPNDVKSWAEQMLIFETRPELCESLKRYTKKQAQKISWDKSSENLQALYESAYHSEKYGLISK